MRESRVLEKLKNGKAVFSTQIGSAYAPFAAIAAQSGFDCIWLDMEHKAVEDWQIRECILASAVYNCDTLVRIKKRGYLDYFKPLEDGAAGIMVPHCKSAEEAQFAVNHSKFHPVGMRGMDFTGFCSDYMMAPVEDCIKHSLANTFTMLQIEDIEALDHLDEIAAIKGVDILFIGPADLKQSALRHNRFNQNFMEEVYQKVDQVVKSHQGMYWGTVAGTKDSVAHLLSIGCRFINMRGDFGAVAGGFASFIGDCRSAADSLSL
ncbi:MAG: HpcH/HpaI aldolase family protein [Candidatus Merdivicinus sp.]|jgi:4-hydroxy-2-oxoheptanedioate aldolase